MASLNRPLRSCLLLALTILLQSSSRIYGQAPDAKSKATGSISGRVTIGDKPALGILVTATVMNTQTLVGQATSDADGNYRISGLSPGQLNITPAAAAYVFPASPMYGQGRVVSLSSNEAVDGIDFKLTRGGVITGRVTDADGRPVIEERITLLPVDENGGPARTMFSRPSTFQMYQTDDRGVYRLYGLSPGHYKVSAGDQAGRVAGVRAGGYYQQVYYPDAMDAAKASIVNLNEGAEAKNIDITLGRRASTYLVSGRVLDADTKQPLSDVQFALGIIQQNQNESYIAGTFSSGTPTNSQGEFRFEGVEPGRYAIFVSSSRFNPNSNSGPKVYSDPVVFEVVDSDVTNLDVKAQTGLSITGVVVPEAISDKTALAKLSRLMVTASVNPGPGELRVYPNGAMSPVNSDGSFSLDGLRPGKVSINLGGFNGLDAQGFTISRIEQNGVTQNRDVDLQPGQNASGVRIYVAFGTGVVRGQLKVEGGTLAGDAVILVSLSREGMGRSSVQVDSRGRFVVQNLAAGTYEVMIQIVSLGSSGPMPRNLPRSQRQTVTVTDGAETEVLFTLDLTRKDVP
jgi:protocatechuate 3,4-dioxygenase beta subunit